MHTLSTPALGLALSGGVARGFVHIGVLKALEEENIPISYVGGASAGALIAYCYAAGLKANHLIEISKELTWWHFARPTFSTRGIVSFRPLEKWLIKTMGDLEFSDLVHPLVVSATDINRGRSVFLHEGQVAKAIHASCAVPGIVKPVKIGENEFVDGGVTNNLPVDAVRQMGATYVIGVDVFDPRPVPILGPLGMALYAAEIMVRNTNNGRKEADCLIAPDLRRFSFGRFGRFRDKLLMIEAGYLETQKQIPEIRRLLNTEQHPKISVQRNRKSWAI